VTRVGVLLGSTRPGRRGEPVARWVMDEASRRSDAEFELIDLADYPLPHLDEPLPPSMGQYQNAHTREWAATIGRFDGYVFVTPEYNHGTSGVLKNAIDFLYAEWNNKAMGVVSYGATSGVRAAEHLRLVAGELQMADVRAPGRAPRHALRPGHCLEPGAGATAAGHPGRRVSDEWNASAWLQTPQREQET
jgi:NAD(P)H-dependent FMN reductase